MMFLLLIKTTRMKLGLPLLAPIPSSSSFVGSHEPLSNNGQVMIPFSKTLKLAVIKVCLCSGIDEEDGGRIGWWARKEEKKQEEEEQEY